MMPKWVVAIIAATLAGILGFACGAILTRPDHKEVDGQIMAAQQRAIQLQLERDKLAAQADDYQGRLTKLADRIISVRDQLESCQWELASTTPTRPQSSRSHAAHVADTAIFGVYLGEPFAKLRKRMNVGNDPITTDAQTTQWLMPSTNPAAASQIVGVYRGRAYSLFAEMRDASEDNYKVIAEQLESKYGKPIHRTKFMDKAHGYMASLGDAQVLIYLQWKNRYGLSENNLTLSYVHYDLHEQLMAEEKEAKRRELGNDF